MNKSPGERPPKEASLRSYLARHLDIIEPSLVLVKEEYRLPNPNGASGSIDILAKHTSGQFVVIELKRADQTARQALHEIEKYVALLASTRGIRVDQLRCIVLSTTWHELLVPFARFVSHADFHADGRLLVLDEKGEPAAVQQVALPALSTGVEICPQHTIYLFDSADTRDEAAKDIDTVLADHAVADYIAVRMDHATDDPRIMYPFLLYLVLAEFSEDLRRHVAPQIRDWISSEDEEQYDAKDDDLDHDGIGVDELRWQYEEGVFANISRTIVGLVDEVNIGSPDVFLQLTSGWEAIEWRGSGRFADDHVWSDEALQEAVAGVSEPYSANFARQAAVAHGAAWERMRKSLDYVLLGSDWMATVKALLDTLERRPGAEISVNVYAPFNLLSELNQLVRLNDGFSPMAAFRMEILDGDYYRIVAGTRIWDGSTVIPSAQSMLDAAFQGDFFMYLLDSNLGELWKTDALLCQLHGLRYMLFEFSPDNDDGTPGETVMLDIDDQRSLTRTAISLDELPTPLDYIKANNTYLAELASLFDQDIFTM